MEGAVVEDSVLMGDCVIDEGAVVEYAIIDREVEVRAAARIGKPRCEASGITVIGEGVVVEAGAVVADGAILPE